MSHLYCECQKHKHFGFSNVRFRRGSIVKSVYIIMVVVVSLHHQQSDNFCKIQKKNVGLEPSFMWDASLSFFPLKPPVYVCYTALRARGACPMQVYCLLSLFTWPILTSILFVRGTGRNWTAGLVTTGCLVVRLRLWQPWHTFKTSLNWTDIAW